MRIFNEDKSQEIKDFDKKLYYLKPDKLLIKHHEAVEEVLRQVHYEVVRTNPLTGGVEYTEVVDVPYQPAIEAYDEYEDILVIVPYTPEELNKNKLEDLTNWFNVYFRMQLEQHSWQKDYKPSVDPYFINEDGTSKTYETFEDVVAQATMVRDEIKKLKSLAL